jgi:myo-inositol-1(or 4)-monophosphatase
MRLSRADDIDCIRAALEAAARLIADSDPRRVEITRRKDEDVTTALDHAINRTLLEHLCPYADGWLSEETEDDLKRLDAFRVWVVDPIDGTREYVAGIPEWCVSVALIEDQRVAAGGVLNPSTGELFLGSVETGLSILNPLMGSFASRNDVPRVLVSRREYRSGTWKTHEKGEFEIKPVGSIAYRLALVAAGYASATCTFEPRSEWDIAAGAALLRAASGHIQMPNGNDMLFNQPSVVIHGCLAFASDCPWSIRQHFCACAKGQEGGARGLGPSETAVPGKRG